MTGYRGPSFSLTPHLDQRVRVADGASVVGHQVRDLVLGHLNLVVVVVMVMAKVTMHLVWSNDCCRTVYLGLLWEPT